MRAFAHICDSYQKLAYRYNWKADIAVSVQPLD